MLKTYLPVAVIDLTHRSLYVEPPTPNSFNPAVVPALLDESAARKVINKVLSSGLMPGQSIELVVRPKTIAVYQWLAQYLVTEANKLGDFAIRVRCEDAGTVAEWHQALSEAQTNAVSGGR